jgi:protein-arginine kinase activator protein McsA
MNCQRCQVNEAEYLVYTDTINLKVCISCAIIAVELEIAVDTIPKLRSIHLPGNVLDGDLPLNSAA